MTYYSVALRAPVATPSEIRLDRGLFRIIQEAIMSMAKILPLAGSLSHADKSQLTQSLLTQLALEEGLSRQSPPPMQTGLEIDRGQRMATILQRMADRQALSHITVPMAWQREIRKDRPLPGRE